MTSLFWQSKPWQAFKTFAIIFSFIVNFILVATLLLILPNILPIIPSVVTPIVGGLTSNFEAMNQATITSTVPIDSDLDIAFIQPLQTETNVVLADAVPLNVNASFLLPGGGGNINGTVSIELPAGTVLPVFLNLDVPVEQTVPVVLEVDVAIPLEETELSEPFLELKNLFTPLESFLGNLPADNDELRARLGNAISPTNSSVDDQTDSDEVGSQLDLDIEETESN